MGIRIVVQADDFGMCHAVNEAVVECFVDGLVTQSSMMPPCPWVDEAAALALEHDIPVGMHCTLTCEWDFLRWAPLTDGKTLREDDGTFTRTLDAAMQRTDVDEGTAELRAQFARLQGFGLAPIYLDCHMGPTSAGAFQHLVDQTGLPFLYKFTQPSFDFDRIFSLSDRSTNADEKTDWLVRNLEKLTDGTYLFVCHPGRDTDELRSICRPDAFNREWALDYRTSDLAALTAPAARAVVERRGIELITAAEVASS